MTFYGCSNYVARQFGLSTPASTAKDDSAAKALQAPAQQKPGMNDSLAAPKPKPNDPQGDKALGYDKAGLERLIENPNNNPNNK